MKLFSKLCLLLILSGCAILNRNFNTKPIELYQTDINQKTIQKAYDKDTAYYHQDKLFLKYIAEQTRKLLKKYKFLDQSYLDGHLIDATELTVALRISRSRGVKNANEAFVQKMQGLTKKLTTYIKTEIKKLGEEVSWLK